MFGDMGNRFQVEIKEAHRGRVKLDFKGPAEVPIHREEVHQRIEADRLPWDTPGVCDEVSFVTDVQLA